MRPAADSESAGSSPETETDLDSLLAELAWSSEDLAELLAELAWSSEDLDVLLAELAPSGEGLAQLLAELAANVEADLAEMLAVTCPGCGLRFEP